jgi:hypothetical protein
VTYRVAASSFKAMRAAMSQGWSGCLWAGSAEATRCCGAAKRVHTKAGSKQYAEHDTRRLATARYKRRALHRQPVSASRAAGVERSSERVGGRGMGLGWLR